MAEPRIAVYDDPDRAAEALDRLDSLRIAGVRVTSPAAYPAVHKTGSPGPWRLLAWLALLGGLVGLGGAIWLQVGTSLAHPVHVGGKPVVAWIPYGVIMFELTMLGAGSTCFVSLVVLAAIARRRVARAARREMASDRLVIAVPAAEPGSERAGAIDEALAGELPATEGR